MAVKTVTATINGQNYTLTYNSSTGKYEASITAPSTSSYSQTNHVYNVSVTAVDDAGNSTTVDGSDATFGAQLKLRVLEKTAPVITPTYPAASAHITSAKPTIKWKVTDSGSGVSTGTVTLKVDSTAVAASSISKTAITNGYEFSYTPTTALSNGSHTLVFNAADNDGNNATQKTVSFVVDTVAPSLSVSEPTNNSYTNSATVHVKGSTSDANSTPVSIAIKVGTTDQGAVTVGTDGSFDKVVTLKTGTNTITVTATDAAGLTTTVTRTVVLDTTAPQFQTISVTPNPVDAGQTYIISVSVTDA